nr:hypothetical protein [uncultured Undibacterium sp.]
MLSQKKFALFVSTVFVSLLFMRETAHAQTGNTSISLECTGSGSISATQTGFENRYNPKTKSYERSTVQNMVRRPFTGTSHVEISGNSLRIGLPPDMVPLINSMKDGWFSIDDLFMNEREITGKVHINGFSQPDLRIDRTTGSISIHNGLSDFSGKCELIDANAKPKF